MMRSTFARTSEVDEHQNQMNFLFEENDDILLDIESDDLIENILLFIDFNISVFCILFLKNKINAGGYAKINK